MSAEPHMTTNGKRVLQLRATEVCRTYGVMIRFDEKTKVHYETEVSLSPDPDEGFRFLINRKQVYINNHAPDLMIDKLADDLGKVLYPLVIRSDEQGNMIGLINRTELIARWNQRKEKITQYYKGHLVDLAVAAMESALEHEKSVIQRLKEDWFFSLFFSGIYGLRTYDFREGTLVKLPMIPYSPLLRYAVTREITKQHTESKCLIVDCKGQLEEHRSAEDILLKNPVPIYQAIHGHATQAEGAVKITYQLYHEDFGIRSITGECSFKDPQVGWQYIAFEVYHLSEKDKQADFYQPNSVKNL